MIKYIERKQESGKIKMIIGLSNIFGRKEAIKLKIKHVVFFLKPTGIISMNSDLVTFLRLRQQ
jgi:hypothetical protein